MAPQRLRQLHQAIGARHAPLRLMLQHYRMILTENVRNDSA